MQDRINGNYYTYPIVSAQVFFSAAKQDAAYFKEKAARKRKYRIFVVIYKRYLQIYYPMKTISNSILRSAFAIILGFVLVLWPEAAILYLVITIGILFILPGLFTVLSYFTRDKSNHPMFPIEGAGSILFGAWLVIMPEFFVNILMYLLGALLVIAGIQQVVMLISARKWNRVPLGFYLMPALILTTGILILTYPFGTAANTFVIFGIASLFYGVCELINWYKFRKKDAAAAL